MCGFEDEPKTGKPEANIDRYLEEVLIDNDAGLSVKGSKQFIVEGKPSISAGLRRRVKFARPRPAAD